jgi:hypothetical protein
MRDNLTVRGDASERFGDRRQSCLAVLVKQPRNRVVADVEWLFWGHARQGAYAIGGLSGGHLRRS